MFIEDIVPVEATAVLAEMREPTIILYLSLFKALASLEKLRRLSIIISTTVEYCHN